MKIIISSESDTIESLFDSRFGRANYFCIYDSESAKCKFVENEFANSNNAAGQKAAEYAAENDVKQIISGDFGPKAKDALDQFGIQMVIIEDKQQSISDIINSLNKKYEK
ncbi:MAG: dinitrogenase iron-molybdenum cofactor biosynthesis protein [Marinifilaceae bacterium]|jgi:predicted Fe-Mo cluster-binding NifX family protein|nr:dinitrogenase iron-molybdenum cofactor biosynthesis protein [Marinifilaceae bacterium]